MEELNFKGIAKLAIGFIFAIVLFSVAMGSFYTVEQGSRAFVLRFGEVIDVTSEGLHLKAPFIDNVIITNVRTQKAESPADAGTKDLQHVNTKVALNYHLKPESLRDTYNRIGLDVEGKVIDPRIQETVKGVVARFSAEELLSKRDDVKREIENSLRTQLATYNIELEAIQITNFSFSPSFNAAIEAKQTAEQNALKAKNDLVRVEVEAQQQIATAKGTAEAIRIQSEAIKAQGGKEYVQLKYIEKWDGKQPVVQGNSGGLILDMKGLQE